MAQSMDQFSKRFKKTLKKIYKDIEDQSILKDALEDLAGDIKRRTRKGFSVDANNTSKKKLKPLSANYKKQRKKMKLSSETSPKRSNLTKSGDMLDSIEVKKNKIVLSGRDNNDKAKWNEDKGRPFLYASKQELVRFIDNLQKKINKVVQKYL